MTSLMHGRSSLSPATGTKGITPDSWQTSGSRHCSPDLALFKESATRRNRGAGGRGADHRIVTFLCLGTRRPFASAMTPGQCAP